MKSAPARQYQVLVVQKFPVLWRYFLKVSSVYSSLIHEIHQYHGCVIGFSGDAITCWFKGDSGWVATSCAFKLQAASANLPESFSVFAIKVVVVSGEVHRYLVGDPETQQLIGLFK